jgi:hypothetical protein
VERTLEDGGSGRVERTGGGEGGAPDAKKNEISFYFILNREILEILFMVKITDLHSTPMHSTPEASSTRRDALRWSFCYKGRLR